MRITAWQVKSSESSRVHTVGFTSPDGTWHTDSDHGSHQAAVDRAIVLNGRLMQYVYIMGDEAGSIVWHVGYYHQVGGTWIPMATCSRAEARRMVIRLNSPDLPQPTIGEMGWVRAASDAHVGWPLASEASLAGKAGFLIHMSQQPAASQAHQDEPQQAHQHPLASFTYPDGELAIQAILAASARPDVQVWLLTELFVKSWRPQIQALAQRIVNDLNDPTYDELESPEARQMRLARNIHRLIHSRLKQS